MRAGLGFSYPTIPTISTPGPGLQEYHYTYSQDFIAGMTGLNAPVVKVDGWSDWTVTPSWSDGTRTMTATIGHGLPMTYFKVSRRRRRAHRERHPADLAEHRRHGRFHA